LQPIEGLSKMAIVNQAERAFRTWSILTECAMNRGTITYGELGRRIGIHHRPIRFVLELIQDYCLNEKLPPLTILVVNQKGLPGTGFIAWDIDNLQEGIEKVHSYPWITSPNPFTYAADGKTDEELSEILVQNPDKATDVYGRVKVRGAAQGIFRKTLLKAYANKCAFSGISIPEILDAVHIVPWSKCEQGERLDPRNGLLCTNMHHKLFDAGKIFVTEEYRISLNNYLLNRRNTSKMERILIKRLHGEKLSLPVNQSLWPSPALIRRHNELWGYNG
jgi:HNH endonuclease